MSLVLRCQNICIYDAQKSIKKSEKRSQSMIDKQPLYMVVRNVCGFQRLTVGRYTPDVGYVTFGI